MSLPIPTCVPTYDTRMPVGDDFSRQTRSQSSTQAELSRHNYRRPLFLLIYVVGERQTMNAREIIIGDVLSPRDYFEPSARLFLAHAHLSRPLVVTTFYRRTDCNFPDDSESVQRRQCRTLASPLFVGSYLRFISNTNYFT